MQTHTTKNGHVINQRYLEKCVNITYIVGTLIIIESYQKNYKKSSRFFFNVVYILI